MIVVRRLVAGDLVRLGAEAAEAAQRDLMTAEAEAEIIRADPYARTIDVDGEPVAAAGFRDCGHGVAVTWMVCREPAGRYIVPFCRAYLRLVATTPFHWIEAQVDASIETSLRLVRLLGFKPVDGEPIHNGAGPFRRFVLQGPS